MSSYYCSLDWGLLHWAFFTVFTRILFLFNAAYVLYYCERGGVDLMGLKPNR